MLTGYVREPAALPAQSGMLGPTSSRKLIGDKMTLEHSISPDGEKFLLPTKEEYELEFRRLENLAAANRAKGREIVVVIGMGFVGAVMAAVVADSTDASGAPGKFVIGMQRPSTRSFWKIPLLNRGVAPIKSEDPEVPEIIRRCVVDKQTLTASFTYKALALADVVVVDVQCDYIKEALNDISTGYVQMEELEKALEIIGETIQPHALVLIETTVPPGTTEQVAYPVIKKAFRTRNIASEPVLAHSYERVMPGANYVNSIRNFWRVCSGINQESRDRVVKFLNEVIDTKNFPLTCLDRPMESETAKIVENSYRATILGFLNEWSLFSERNGVDLIKVIDAIKVRPTHSNLIFPGPGIGGYCLPKDGGLGVWAYKHLMGFEDALFKITPLAININDSRALHVPELARDALRNMGRYIAASKVALLGASYREDVGDTRYSGSEIILRRLAEMGAEVCVHDPYVDHWWEFEAQATYPMPGKSRSRFFRGQKKLNVLAVAKTLDEALQGADAVIFAVRHRQFLDLQPEKVVEAAGGPIAVIDCFGMLNDDRIKHYFQLGCEVKGLGRGHINRLKKLYKK
ncbi:MAG TPA: nucleotide sugar dehydrogenase [Desulfomonilaceae bacterium]|nr:nucleotide sugar dehydrogenase [Desulfomonilaceae bacterium]